MEAFLAFVFTVGSASIVSAAKGLGAKSGWGRGIGLVLGPPGALLGFVFLFTFTLQGFAIALVGCSGVVAAIYRVVRPMPPQTELSMPPSEIVAAAYAIPSPPRSVF